MTHQNRFRHRVYSIATIVGWLVFLVGSPALLKAAPTDLADTQPADPGPSTKTMAKGTITYTEPGDGWEELPANATDVRAVYFLHDRASAVSVEILPADAKIGPEMVAAIVRRVRQMHQQSREQLVEGPTAEKDERFPVRIHEKFHTTTKVDGKPTDKIATQVHLYRNVGPRIMMITVWSTADSEDELKQAQVAAEQIALSATFSKPQKKR